MTDIEGPVVIRGQSQTEPQLVIEGYPDQDVGDFFRCTDGNSKEPVAAITVDGRFVGMSGYEVGVHALFVFADGTPAFDTPGLLSVEHPSPGLYVLHFDPYHVKPDAYLALVSPANPVWTTTTRYADRVEFLFKDNTAAPDDTDFECLFVTVPKPILRRRDHA